MSRTTIKDIAGKLGVSPATVSNVLNGRRERVSQKTADAVLNAVRELGYRPNVFARGLAGRRSDTLGLVVADVLSPLFAQAIAGAEAVASRLGYHLILCNSRNDEDADAASVRLLLDRQVDGMIFIASSGIKQMKAIAAVAQAGVPFVMINRLTDPEKGLHILIENERGTYEITHYLIELGHTRLACIHLPVNGPMARRAFIERLQGFERALADYGIARIPEWIRPGVPGGTTGTAMAVGYSLTMEMLQMETRPTAVVCCNDHLAVGAIRAAHALGLRVPEDLSVTGNDDELAAAYATPPLTTVRQPMEAAGARAAEALIQSLWKGVSLKGIEYLRCELVVRSSAAPYLESTANLEQ